LDIKNVELIEPSPYVKYLEDRDEGAGYSDDGRQLTIKRFRSFRFNFGNEECRKYFIDDFCERCEKAYGTFVKLYSGAAVELLKEKYGSHIDITHEISTHSEVESHTWDDEDEDDYYTESTTVYVMVVHTYRLRLKGDKSKNEIKLKYPELTNVGLFNGEYKDNNSSIKAWFNNTILSEAKSILDNKEVVSALRNKAGLM